ncbi:MAG: hypothetical protein JW885_09740 [Deltaproteobacteria bacterium]|nr:hypothetical protein [Candidatus Zymogenaceae bacterium]
MIAPGNSRRRGLFFSIFFCLTLILFLIGCTPSPEELYESRLKEHENRELVERIIELERQVEKLQQELETCREDYGNLLYYNREKAEMMEKIEALEKEVKTLRGTSR